MWKHLLPINTCACINAYRHHKTLTINAPACLDAYATPTLPSWLPSHTTGQVAESLRLELRKKLIEEDLLSRNFWL